MAVIKSTSVTTSELLSAVNQPGQRLISVRVIDIILNENHNKFNEFGNYDSIGTIFYTKIEDDTPLESEKYASSAKPLFSFIKSYPLINEIVLIVSANDKKIYNTPNSITNYYLPNINVWNSPHHNALPTVKGLKETTTVRNYENTQNGIVKSPTDPPQIPLGNYFNEQLNIKSLLPYEGDNIIEGRFGNSIRFGSTTTPLNPWSITGSIGDPITIIRNGQDKSLTTGWIPTIEDINNDNSSLYMTSTQQLSNFIPSSTNQKSFGANFIAPVPIEVQFTQIPANMVVIEPTPTPIPNEEFLIDESEPYVPNIQPIPTSSTPISDDPFGDFEAEVLEANGPVGWYEIELETDINTITPSSQTNITHTDDFTETEGALILGDFNYDLFCESDTATNENIQNIPGIDPDIPKADIMSNLVKLEENIIRKIREQYPTIILTSTYRCKELNTFITGSSTSDHLYGKAVDFQVPNVHTKELFNWCSLNLPSYSQLIWEYPERGFPPNGSWIHISYNEEKGNGKESFVTTNNPSKYQVIQAGGPYNYGIATEQSVE
tara:strand:+ start:39 stop:1685 length:1647 start_codon:yes stop_codon:yes gene_type:complete